MAAGAVGRRARNSSTPSTRSSERTGIAELLRALAAQGIDFKDLQTAQSSLEDIFVSLVRKDDA